MTKASVGEPLQGRNQALSVRFSPRIALRHRRFFAPGDFDIALFFVFGVVGMGTGVVIAGMARQSLRIALSPMPLRNDRFFKEIVQEGCLRPRPQGPGARVQGTGRSRRRRKVKKEG
jgi:hypothetical protein